MKRRFRLTSSADVRRVRNTGKSYAHPLLVLVVLPSGLDGVRAAVAAGRSLGSAVSRNRAKRRLRAALGPILPRLRPGWDLLVIARTPLFQADFSEIQNALISLLQKARLASNQHDQ